MRGFSPIRSLAVLALLVAAVAVGGAQELPRGTTPRGVVYSFLTETASADDSVNRGAFHDRLMGEFAQSDPRTFKGMFPRNAHLHIDSIPLLGGAEGDYSRAVAYVTVESGGQKENWYLYCAGDTIWRIEALRRFPSPLQRSQIRQSLQEIDTSTAAYRILHTDLQRMLLPDDSLRAILRLNRADAEKIAAPLARGRRWNDFALRDVDFGKLEEYRELDDDIDGSDLIFYTLDRPALERLKRKVGIKRIERDPRYPDLILFVAGTLEKGSYGYINAPDSRSLPPVSRTEFITLKPVADNWWFYKKIK
ncbi:MAG: hypothetical protein ABIR47_04800 [Candidatus Kapaibacterium sp.]